MCCRPIARVVSFVALALAGSTLAWNAFAAERPNVLLLISDDQRPDTLGALGNPHIRTPQLDALARQGVVFPNASCAHPLCFPSRAELLTGCTGFRNGTYSQLKLAPAVPLWPEVMKQAGYRTGYVGKWHTAGRPSRIGFEACDGLYGSGQRSDRPYLDFRGRPATGYVGWQFQTDAGQRFPEEGIGLTPDISAKFAEAAIRLIQQPSDQPFFIQVNFTAPHDPRIWPTGAERSYDPDSLPLPPNFLPEHPFDHGNARGRDELLLPFPRAADDVRQELACYYAVIADLDAQIGRILAALAASGQQENTLVIFTSDHGLAVGSHGLVGKQNMYAHTIQVPLIVAGPGIAKGEQRTAQCYLRDLFPTVCDLAKIAHPPVDGRSLLPVLHGDRQEIYPFTVGYFQDSQRMIRQGQTKLIWYPKINRWQYFDLAIDPHELDDLIDKPAHFQAINQLKISLLAWLKEQGDPLAAERG